MDTTFDRSSYVVVRKDSARRRRTGSFGEAQPELMSAVSNSSEWDFEANFEHPVPQNTSVVMMEQYNSSQTQQKRLTGKDFMDGSDFMTSGNLFRESHTSQRWNSDIMERPSHSFETQPDEFHADGIEKLVQQLRVSLNHEKRDENTKPRAINPASPYKEEDHGTEPTAPNTEPNTTPRSSLPSSSKEKKDKKKSKSKKEHKKKSKRRHSRLPSVVPPDEIHLSDSLTVASSVGGLTAFQCQEKIRNLLDRGRYEDDALPTQALNTRAHLAARAPREVDISAPLTVASSVGQESGWVMNCQKRKPQKSSPREIDISAPMTVQSSLGGEESSLFRHARASKGARPLNLEKVKTSLEIDVTEHTVVSSLGESMGDRRAYKPLAASPQKEPDAYYRGTLHHQLYRSNSRDY